MTTITETPTENKQALDTSKAARLGTVVSIVAAGQKSKYRRYSELAHAQHLMIESNVRNTKDGIHRTRRCSAARAYQAETISIKLSSNPEHSHASLAGVQTCGNIWGCPVCGVRIGVQRGKEIRAALRWAAENGLQPIMLTFTASHHENMTLDGFKSQFKAAYRALTQSRSWRQVKKKLQIQHGIKAVEPTLGKKGWHYHYHVLMFVPIDALRELGDHELVNWRKDARAAWLHELGKVGLSGIGKFALDFSFHGGVGEHYLSKLGLDDTALTDAGHELSGSGNKDGSGATVWTILRRSQTESETETDTPVHERQWSKKYIEYVKAMQGENWITWSHGLKALVGVDDVSDDVLADDESADTPDFEMLDWLQISDDQYRAVRKFRLYRELLELAAATRSKKAVLAYLDGLQAVWEKMHAEEVKDLRQQYSWVSDCMRACQVSMNKKYNSFGAKRLIVLTDERQAIKRQLSYLGEDV